MNATLLKTCFLTTSIEFLTPESSLFENNLKNNSELNCEVFKVDQPSDFYRLTECIYQFDVFIIDSWALLLDSQFITGNFRELHIYPHDFQVACKQLLAFKKWILELLRINSKSQLFVLYCGVLDYWRIHQADLDLLKTLLEINNFILWSPSSFFCNDKDSCKSYASIISSASKSNQYLELRHVIDPSYDATAKDINKIFRLGLLPSLAPERVKLFKDLNHLMCLSSQNLYKQAISRLVEYKQHMAKFNQENNLDILCQVREKQAALNMAYRRILLLSKFIATTPTRYRAFIRKYVEVPNAGCILIANECGWEDKIFRFHSFPMIKLDSENNLLNIEKLDKMYDESHEKLACTQNLIQKFGTYQSRIYNLISFCFSKA